MRITSRRSSIAHSPSQRVADSGKNLAGPLLLALLRAQHQDRTREHRQYPLQVAQLSLRCRDVARSGRGRLSRAIDRMSVTLSSFRAEDAAVDGGAQRG